VTIHDNKGGHTGVYLSYVQVYDGLRLRALPALYKALQPGTDDDRMKGALWTLNISIFGE
jgi:proteasome activator subunit 4